MKDIDFHTFFFADEFFGKLSDRNQIVGNALESLCNDFLKFALRFEILASLQGYMSEN